MCGIAGIIRFDRKAVDSETLRQVGDCLAHRGPDDLGFLSWPGSGPVHVSRTPESLPESWLALAHRRLSILDLTQAGAQPMATSDARYSIVYNGEIYNFVELRRELEKLGHGFRGRSDTEVLLAAWAQWQAKTLGRLIGMFAFAILDTRERTLLLARDFFGIKPLYYIHAEGLFAFASEIKALLRLPEVKLRADPGRLYEYLRFGITDHGGETLLAGIRQVPAAHYIRIPLDRPAAPEPVRFWQVDRNNRLEISFDQAADRLRELFVANVGLHLRSDVPVGTALSGGIDSSAIVAVMRQLQGPGHEIHTFSYIARDSALSEERWVDLAGEAAGAVVHKVRPRPAELVAELDNLIDVQDEPVSSTSMYAQYRVFRLARESGIKVMLDGQGADEILGGYRYYVGAMVTSLIRRGQLLRAARLLARSLRLPGPGGGLWMLAYTGAFLVPPSLRPLAMRLIGEDLVPPWMNAHWFKARGVPPRFPWPCRDREALREQLHLTLVRTSLPKLLRYEDRNSMAFSVESRVPFLTPELVEFCLSLPEGYHIAPDGTGKALFRHAMRGIVPQPILNRRDKIGFQTPERQWLEALKPWVSDVLRSEAARRIPPLNYRQVQREWELVLDGKKRFDHRFWRLVNTIRWVERKHVCFDS